MRHCMEPAYTSLNCVRRLTETRNGDYARHPMQGLGDSAMSRRIIQDLSFTPLVSGCGRGFSPTTPISFSRKQPNPRKDLCPAGHRANPFNNPPPPHRHPFSTDLRQPTHTQQQPTSKQKGTSASCAIQLAEVPSQRFPSKAAQRPFTPALQRRWHQPVIRDGDEAL